MNKEITEGLLKIINHYGIMTQLKYFQSEIFELNEAIIRYEEYGSIDDDYLEHIQEEITDVLVMVNQFIEYYEFSSNDILKIAINKIERQLERIGSDKDEFRESNKT